MYDRHQIKAFLEKAQCFDLQPCRVTIGKESWEACRYKQTMPPLTNAENPEPHTREMIYCAGMLPAIKLRRNACFTVEGDTREWYVAGYAGEVKGGKQAVVPPSQPYSPFGNSFLLAPWQTNNGEKIDSYECNQYLRLPLIVTEN